MLTNICITSEQISWSCS